MGGEKVHGFVALKITEISPAFDRIALLREFDPRTATYIVSDLQTKLDIQKILFERYDFLAEDAVLRANELWRKLLSRADSDLQIVSQSLLQSMLSEWLEQQDIPWAGGSGAAQNLLQAIQQFLPIYLAPQGDELFKEWLKKNENALLRMAQWFFLGREAWNFLLEKRVIATAWAPAVLSQLPELPEWPRPLLLDLEANLTGIEGDLIRRLAESGSVEVLAPAAEWCRRYSKVLWPYDILCGRQLDNAPRETRAKNAGVETRRFTTRMTEGKDVVGQVRVWLDKGVPMHEIAVLAPDIEEYWPLIASYFEVEGIPVHKSKVAPLHSFIEISAWLARLRVEAKSLDADDLELTLYNPRRRHEMDFADFRALFRRVYDFNDLQRDQELFRLFNSGADERSRWSRDAFVTWILKRWNLDDPVDNLRQLVGKLLDETPPNIEMSLRAWLRYLEAAAAKMEKTLAPAGDGIVFAKVDSGFHQKWSHVMVIGLTESAVKGADSSMLTLGDILQIGQDLGFYLDYPDKPLVECMVDWICSRDGRKAILSFAATNFSGEPEAPSLFWLSMALANGASIEKYTEPAVTRWDQIQANHAAFAEILVNHVKEDLGLAAPAVLELARLPSLSASQVERYIQCPFKFTADKILKLEDPAEVDLDLDHRVRGRVQHALFEKLLEEPLRLERSPQELAELVDGLRRDERVILGDPRLWPSLRSRLVSLAEKFLRFEREWRAQFPGTRTIGREMAFEVGYSLDRGEFCAKDSGDFNFRGRLDRVDEGPGGEIILLDYKSSDHDLTNYDAWPRKGQLQLALYSMVIESGYTDLGARTVAGAFYYVTKTFEREKGLRLDSASGQILPPPRTGNDISAEKKNALFAEVRGKLNEVAVAIRAGRLHAHPVKPQDCPKCRWRRVCRAPHLN